MQHDESGPGKNTAMIFNDTTAMRDMLSRVMARLNMRVAQPEDDDIFLSGIACQDRVRRILERAQERRISRTDA